jgi:deoxyribodipyrimidine photo-lyase
MSRDQRAEDNWALLEAARLAAGNGRFPVCVFTLDTAYPGANYRHYSFMLRGLRETESVLRAHGIPLEILRGHPPESLSLFAKRHDIHSVICDFDPLRVKRGWKNEFLSRTQCPVIEADAHNLVPCRIASVKEEIGARTFRPKIARLLEEYLDIFPPLPVFGSEHQGYEPPDFDSITESSAFDRSVGETGIVPGTAAAHRVLESFIAEKISSYSDRANDPNSDAVSGLSPYLHFGQISAQRAAMEIFRRCAPSPGRDAFLEQLIIRRELSDNFCFYNPSYDSFDGFPAWAKRSHERHRGDEREYLYTRFELENAATHDALWNAAQRELTVTGKMHNYMRMYWAKKILEWSPSPEEALSAAIHLNDKYSLDGRDPNGYAGCAWSIGGVHDRAWPERRVFGQIRYMNSSGCWRKFNVDAYIERNGG